MNEYDVVVIGGGAAGLSAALVLGRARRRVALVDAGRPRNAPAAHMQGFLSRDGMPPAELSATGRGEVLGYGVEIFDGEVVRLEPGFEAVLADGTRLVARRVLVTTGLRDQIPDIPGLAPRWGRDVLHCPYCHGYEVRDQSLGVLGGDSGAIAHAILIKQWSDDVILFADQAEISPADKELLDARGIAIEPSAIEQVVVEHDALRGVVVENGRVVPRSAVFVRPTFSPNDTLLRDLGCSIGDEGWISHDSAGATSIPGVYVAGNASDPRAQVITAAGHGSAVAISMNADLIADDVQAELDTLRNRPEPRNSKVPDLL